jgi:hypothetical protein
VRVRLIQGDETLNTIIGVVLLLAGLLGAFNGWRIFKILLPIYWAIVGFYIGYVIGLDLSSGNESTALILAVVGALVAAVLSGLLFSFGVAIAGALGGAALGAAIAATLNLPTLGLALCVALGVVIGVVLAAVLKNVAIVLGTAIQGALMATIGIQFLVPSLEIARFSSANQAQLLSLGLVIFIGIAVIGSFVQLRNPELWRATR